MTGRVDQASRNVPAPPSVVYKALTDPDALTAWLPPEGMIARLHSFDLKVGGGYRMELIYRNADGGRGKTRTDADIVDVRFTALSPDACIAQVVAFESDNPAFAGQMKMSWLLAPSANGTQVAIRCEDVPPGISEADHAVGLASSLDNLATFVAQDE